MNLCQVLPTGAHSGFLAVNGRALLPRSGAVVGAAWYRQSQALRGRRDPGLSPGITLHWGGKDPGPTPRLPPGVAPRHNRPVILHDEPFHSGGTGLGVLGRDWARDGQSNTTCQQQRQALFSARAQGMTRSSSKGDWAAGAPAECVAESRPAQTRGRRPMRPGGPGPAFLVRRPRPGRQRLFQVDSSLACGGGSKCLSAKSAVPVCTSWQRLRPSQQLPPLKSARNPNGVPLSWGKSRFHGILTRARPPPEPTHPNESSGSAV